eukprot:1140874-Pelagomonas_calceolata.AAC.3
MTEGRMLARPERAELFKAHVFAECAASAIACTACMQLRVGTERMHVCCPRTVKMAYRTFALPLQTFLRMPMPWLLPFWGAIAHACWW